MENTVLDPVRIRPHIGSRSIGGKLCLINLKRREEWVCGGISLRIWDRLRQGLGTEQIVEQFSAKYGVPAERVRGDVGRFLEQLWQRQIVDLPGREGVSDEERAAMVGEEPHNKSGKLYEYALEASTLFRVWLDLLIPCNLRCRHCYLDFSLKDIVPFDVVCNYLDQLADHGCPEVVLTGGEIFLRKDLLDIVAYTESKGFLFDLYTNANFIDRKMADALSKHLIQNVQISIYGTNAELHEAVTKKAGTFDKSINAAKMLVERGVPVRLEYHIQRDNFEDAFKFPEFATALGATYTFDSKLVPNRNGSNEPLQYSVSLRQQAEIYKAGLMKRETNFICTAAVSKARINAHGDIYPCELINTAVVGNLKQQTLAEIWASGRRTRLREEILGYKPARCGGCNHVSDCQPCAAMRGFHIDENHLEAPVSEACMLTTANILSQGRELPVHSLFEGKTDDCMSAVLAQDEGRTGKTFLPVLPNVSQQA
jgi:radical SAM protein with 4Fe4S-binding SPASM domain